MGRAFARVTPTTLGNAFIGVTPFYHKASDRYYQPLRRGDHFFLRRYQTNPDGSESNALEFEIHYVLGSGNHSRTYLHRDAGNHLVEMPLSWYSEGRGKFEMSPGYDNPAHYDFRRKINYDCFFCHNGYPQLARMWDVLASNLSFRPRCPKELTASAATVPDAPTPTRHSVRIARRTFADAS